MNEDKILLMATKKDSFIVRTIATAMEAIDISVTVVPLDIIDFSAYQYSYIMLVVEDIDAVTIGAVNILLNHCKKNNQKIITLGTKVETAYFEDIFSKDYIALEIFRPLDPKEIASQVSAYLEKNKKLAQRGGKKSILVVDDSGVMLRMIYNWLEQYFVVYLANSTAAADAALVKEIPDLILLDYEMPDCSGAEYMERLRQRNDTRSVPIIFLTSKDDAQTVNEVISHRPQGYILKSMPSEQIVAKISDFFSKNG